MKDVKLKDEEGRKRPSSDAKKLNEDGLKNRRGCEQRRKIGEKRDDLSKRRQRGGAYRKWNGFGWKKRSEDYNKRKI